MHWLESEENLDQGQQCALASVLQIQVYLSATISNMDVGYSDVIHCEVSVPIRKYQAFPLSPSC